LVVVIICECSEGSKTFFQSFLQMSVGFLDPRVVGVESECGGQIVTGLLLVAHHVACVPQHNQGAEVLVVHP
jgi:hypothetical protein